MGAGGVLHGRVETATREVFWNIRHFWLMYVCFVPGGAGVRRSARGILVRRWRRGKPVERLDNWRERLRGLFPRRGRRKSNCAQAIDKPACSTSCISWGFVLLFIGTTVVFIHADLRMPIMQGWFYLVFQSLILDMFGLGAIIGLAIALWHRYVIRPPPADPRRLVRRLLPRGRSWSSW